MMKFFNPFGPYIIHTKLDEESRVATLELIHKLDRDILDGTVKVKGDIVRLGNSKNHLSEVQKNSISNGRMNEIPSSFNDSIIGCMIHQFTNDYFKQHELQNPFYDDSGTLYKHKEHTEWKTHESRLVDAWYVMMEEGDFHILHNHKLPNLSTTVSGAIYLNIPEDIRPPQGDLNFVVNSHDDWLHNASWSVTPNNGDVLIWPGWLRHFVYPFKNNKGSKEKRIMISFNAAWIKKDKDKYWKNIKWQ